MTKDSRGYRCHDLVLNQRLPHETELRAVTSLVRERQLWLYKHVACLPDVDPAYRSVSVLDNHEWGRPRRRAWNSRLARQSIIEGGQNGKGSCVDACLGGFNRMSEEDMPPGVCSVLVSSIADLAGFFLPPIYPSHFPPKGCVPQFGNHCSRINNLLPTQTCHL